uniref:Uncharacterized protein n=1 Tax=Xenopus tropicalis TaxID=8364 RepID=A0A1B8Y092_XENTR
MGENNSIGPASACTASLLSSFFKSLGRRCLVEDAKFPLCSLQGCFCKGRPVIAKYMQAEAESQSFGMLVRQKWPGLTLAEPPEGQQVYSAQDIKDSASPAEAPTLVQYGDAGVSTAERNKL